MSTPTYDELIAGAEVPAGSSWGLFGSDDQLGTINRIGQEEVRRAAGLIRTGAVFSLNWDLELPSPPVLGRVAYRRHQEMQFAGTDDHLDDFYLQASTQWDALKHVRHPKAGYYNGHSVASVEAPGSTELGIHHLARRGIAAPFVLLDLTTGEEPWRSGRSRSYSATDLEDALTRQEVTLWPGTVLLVRTGWMRGYEQASPSQRRELAAAGEALVAPGLRAEEETARWLWDKGVAAVASDSPALESTPFDQSTDDGFLHYRLIALLGMPLGELFYLERLAADCADNGIYEGLFTSAPLNLLGGSGSPANALAVK
jgi:kynurenine formamidase